MIETRVEKLILVSEEIPYEKIETEGRDVYDQLVHAYISLGGGAGLAAPQIGINKRVFIWSSNRKLEKIKVAINPTLKNESNKIKKSIEGCYSMPGVLYEINRFEEINLTYYDLNKDIQNHLFCGFEAIVIQHELDHLNGVLIEKNGLLNKKFKDLHDYKSYIEQLRKESY
jgi:peptide deformylase